jgi:hypothetical protein
MSAGDSVVEEENSDMMSLATFNLRSFLIWKRRRRNELQKKKM